jgi:RNA-directed DNA polymerase
LKALGDVPGKELVREWLKAGVMEDGAYHPTETGTPQGGVISPLLLNVALHGMEAALGVLKDDRGKALKGRAVVRYADDFVVFCENQESALHVKDVLLPNWLAERGLSLSQEKTRIVHLEEGFDFLGFNVRLFPCQTTRTGCKLLIRPSKKSVVKKRKDLKEIWLKLRSQSVRTVLMHLNPIVRGWANYFRTVVSSVIFHKMDHWMFHRAILYAKHMHLNKSQEWRQRRYWGRLNPKRADNWVFGDKQTGQHLLKFSWFGIERHVLVRGTASPDDPRLRGYWWARRKINIRHLTMSDVLLAESQDWRCLVCGRNLIIEGEELHRHHRQPRSMGGSDEASNRELVHLYCHQQRHEKMRRQAADEQMS